MNMEVAYISETSEAVPTAAKGKRTGLIEKTKYGDSLN
jgi:hypothetical protein